MSRHLAAALLGSLVLSLTGISHAAVIFSDNFNSENGGVGTLNYSGFANWTVTNGTVDLIGNGFADFYPGHGLYVDLDGSSGDAGVLTETASFSLAAGTYTLKFLLGGSQRGDTNTVNVALGSLYSESFILASSDPLAMITRTIVVGSPTTAALSFENLGGDNVGAILDDVALSSVPEPGALAMLGVGLFGLGLSRRRRDLAPRR